MKTSETHIGVNFSYCGHVYQCSTHLPQACTYSALSIDSSIGCSHQITDVVTSSSNGQSSPVVRIMSPTQESAPARTSTSPEFAARTAYWRGISITSALELVRTHRMYSRAFATYVPQESSAGSEGRLLRPSKSTSTPPGPRLVNSSTTSTLSPRRPAPVIEFFLSRSKARSCTSMLAFSPRVLMM